MVRLEMAIGGKRNCLLRLNLIQLAMPRKGDRDPADTGDFMPTREQILSKPLPPEPPQTPTQVGLSYLNKIYGILPSGLSAGGLASGLADIFRGTPNPAMDRA
jgi:hypothetical protein